jgi:SDR family mycofactocin-dependent oxidoreductase
MRATIRRLSSASDERNDAVTNLDGQVALVTGAARGMGRAHAVRLAQAGADVLLCDIDEGDDKVAYPLARASELDETAELVRAEGRTAISAIADVRSLEQLQALVRRGDEELGGVDILVANAGVTGYALAHETDEDLWNLMIDVNLKGAWLSAKAVIPGMIERGRGGSLIFISSGLGLKGMSEASHYAAAKHCVVGLMRSLALELAPHFIRSNTVHPAGTSTPMAHNQMHYRRAAPDKENPTLEDALPMFRSIAAMPIDWTEPVDIANAVVWLASDEARYVTGITLPVDGGWYIK